MNRLWRYGLLGVLAAIQGCQQISGGGDDVATRVAYGRIYNQDGSFAPDCRVEAIPSDQVPAASGFSSKFETVTDSVGRYFFESLPDGLYNIYFKKNALGSYRRDVSLGRPGKRDTFPDDTLRPTGGISGIIRLAGLSDSRNVLIMIIGGALIGWPDDSSGSFSLSNLAAGSYDIRFLTTDSRYKVLDTSFEVFSGSIFRVGTIVLPLLNPPDTVPVTVATDTVVVRDRFINGTWGPNKTYKIMNTVVIPPGERLEIREGTKIIFMGNYDFGTNGNCFAKGTIGNPVLFTYGFNYTGKGWHWLGTYQMENGFIATLNPDSLVFDHCIFEYCEQPYFEIGRSVSEIYFKFTNSILRHTSGNMLISCDSAKTSDTGPRIVIEHSVFYDIAFKYRLEWLFPAIALHLNIPDFFPPGNDRVASIRKNVFYEVRWDSGTPYEGFYYQNCYYGIAPDTVTIDSASRINCLFTDPKFIDIEKGDYHLAPGSPCIGAGPDGEDFGLEFN